MQPNLALIYFIFGGLLPGATSRRKQMDPGPCELPRSGELNSFLWTIRRDPPAYLFGTIHVPYTRVWDFIPENSKAAFQASSSVYFELDLTDPYTISGLASCQMLPHGENLQDVLPRELYRRLKRHLEYVKLMLPHWMTPDQRGKGLYADYLFNAIAGNWERKRPVWVMLMVNSLTETDIRSRGVPVLDLYLAQEAERMKKRTGAVERVEEQCHPLNGLNFSQVVLPTFILEKRSLLEMYADFMSHPDLFIAITNGATPEERMIRFVEYYLTSFHEGRKGAIAKKPYNPIIGETFHCSWRMAKGEVASDSNSNSSSLSLSEQATLSQEPEGQVESDYYTVRFVAEQVSHHPPVSGFYAECVEKKMCVNAHVWTKSKFLGMSIGVTMVGEGLLSLLEYGEEYTFSLPCAYARSILTVPWVELGGKVNVNCPKTGYSASITFHTKPFYGGKLHRVTGEVKQNATNTVVCRVQGEWNSVLEFTYSNGETKYVDLTKLSVTRKRVRPLEKQGPFESRRLWQHVTESLKDGDIDKATEHKRALEERQRNEERLRAEREAPWSTKYFVKEGDGWMYYNPLWKTVPTIQTQQMDTN